MLIVTNVLIPIFISLLGIAMPIGIIIAVAMVISAHYEVDKVKKNKINKYAIWCGVGPIVLMFLTLSMWGLIGVIRATFWTNSNNQVSDNISLSSDQKNITSKGEILLSIDNDIIYNWFKKDSQLCNGSNIDSTPDRKLFCDNENVLKEQTKFKSIVISPDKSKIGFTIESDALSPDTVVGVFSKPSNIKILTNYYLGNEFISFSPNGNNFVYSGGCWEARCVFYIKDSTTLKDKINFIPSEADMRENYEFVRWISDNEIEYRLGNTLKKATLIN